MNNKIILGLIGEIASGKSALADFLTDEFQSKTASFSEPLRRILDLLGLPQSRENMVWLGVNLREHFGQDILAKYTFRTITHSFAPIICLPNIRLEGDISLLKTLPHFYLIRIDAEPEIRYKRLTQRTENSDDSTKTWEEFLADSTLSTEIGIRDLPKQAHFSIDNNTCKANLFKQIRSIIKEIKGA